MVTLEAPLLIPMIFMALLLAVGFGIGALISEISLIGERKAADRDSMGEFRWLLLIIPSLVGIFNILWWPTAQIGGG